MQKLGKRIWILIVKYFALCVRVLSVCCQTNNQHHLMMTLAWLVLVFQEHDCERAHFKIPVHEFISPRPCRHTLHSQNNHRSCSSALINLVLVVFHSNRSTIQTLLVSYKARRHVGSSLGGPVVSDKFRLHELCRAHKICTFSPMTI